MPKHVGMVGRVMQEQELERQKRGIKPHTKESAALYLQRM